MDITKCTNYWELSSTATTNAKAIHDGLVTFTGWSTKMYFTPSVAIADLPTVTVDELNRSAYLYVHDLIDQLRSECNQATLIINQNKFYSEKWTNFVKLPLLPDTAPRELDLSAAHLNEWNNAWQALADRVTALQGVFIEYGFNEGE